MEVRIMPQESVCIVAHAYLDPAGECLEIGGVQTYVDALRAVLSRHSVRVDILQPAAVEFEKRLSADTRVIGVRGGFGRLKRVYQGHYRGAYALTIFATFQWAGWADGERAVAVQHGVSWDGFVPKHRGLARHLYKAYKAFMFGQNRRRIAAAMEKVSEVICVDVNFPNWLRATFPFRRWDEKLTYVPNFGDPVSEEQFAVKQRIDGDDARVLIARRFEPYRGFPLIGEIVRDVARRHPRCRFLFAGRGSREDELRSLLSGLENCEIRPVPHDRMQQTCWEADVAVVPTVFSEGTSLSCIEAMCTGTAVLVTAVGGLSNLVLDNYNGLLVEPTRAGLEGGLVRLLEDKALRRRLGQRGYETACECFSRKIWEGRVEQVLARHLGLHVPPAQPAPLRRGRPSRLQPESALAAPPY
jgi:glycosyltransferase involved in cell wall biosynthesis